MVELKEKLESIVIGILLTIGGFSIGSIIIFLTAQIFILIGIDVRESTAIQIVISTVMLQGVTFGVLAIGYIKLTYQGFNFFKIRFPNLRDIGWTIGGTIIFFILYFILNFIISALGIPVAQNRIVQRGIQTPEVLLLLIPFSIILIGPGEELLFRGLIQGTLRQSFQPISAIILASIIFAVSHTVSLSGQGKTTYLIIVFILALFLGSIYEYTENLVNSALIHGIYNAVLFTILYIQIT